MAIFNSYFDITRGYRLSLTLRFLGRGLERFVSERQASSELGGARIHCGHHFQYHSGSIWMILGLPPFRKTPYIILHIYTHK